MHLRRLIVLIINARNIINLIRSCTVEVSIIGPMYNRCIAASGLIGQIKKTRIHVQALCLSEGVGSNETVLHLFTMSKYPAMETSRSQNMAKPCSLFSTSSVSLASAISNQNSIPNEVWWSQTGSNRRHPACKAGALPAELRPRKGSPCEARAAIRSNAPA